MVFELLVGERVEVRVKDVFGLVTKVKVYPQACLWRSSAAQSLENLMKNRWSRRVIVVEYSWLGHLHGRKKAVAGLEVPDERRC